MMKRADFYRKPQVRLLPLRSRLPLCVSPSGAQTESYDEFDNLDGIVH